MKKINHTLLLFAVIVIEGYIVLASELLAIRQTIPFVGSGTDTVSIIIAAVLMPLAFGYQYGGQFTPRRIMGVHVTVRKKLVLNILLASIILLPGMSYKFLFWFFPWLSMIGIEHRLAQTAIYCCLFLVIPVYLLGQTVPLITNFFSRERLASVTGRILFFSTVGSFLGATLSTLVLMSTVGVHHTVTLNFVLMTILVVMLSKRKISKTVLVSFAITLIAISFNSNHIMQGMRIVANNEYNTIATITLKNGDRYLQMNNNNSSKYSDDGRKHPYVEFAERISILPILNSEEPKDILVIGAGGFTFGHEDKNNHYIYIDIDDDLLKISEELILREEIGKNKEFIALPARAYLKSTDQKFDVIFLDAYLGGLSIPEHLVTKEFFEEVKKKMKDKGVLVTNFILSPNFNNVFSRSIDNTFRAVFPHFSRHAIHENYNLWSDSKSWPENIAYVYRHEENYDPGHIYTDDKNTVFYDKPKRFSK